MLNNNESPNRMADPNEEEKDCVQRVTEGSETSENSERGIESQKEGCSNGAEAEKCSNCGFVLQKNQMFCPKCGTPKGMPGKLVCTKCGAELQSGQAYCSNCGERVTPSTEQSRDHTQKSSTVAIIHKVYEDKKKYTIIAIVAIIVVSLVFLLSRTKNFNQMYGDIKGRTWCSIASDGMWMEIDTNPFDEEDGFEISAWNKIESVLNDLGFPSSVAEEMNHTRSIDGRQNAYTDKYEVSWSYHPDHGMEVLFKVK